MIHICFVCLGNICRSPFAEALAKDELKKRKWSEKITIDSAGTSNEHEGERSHHLTRQVGEEMGLVMNHIARPFSRNEFDQWHYILAMDQSNLNWLNRHCPEDQKEKLSLLLSWDNTLTQTNVPDPWGYGIDKYYEMRDLIVTSLNSFFDHLNANHK